MHTSDTATVFKFREFSRFFQFRQVQLTALLKSTDYTAQDGRILFEIDNIQDCCATDLQHKMLIDPGFLSHKLKRLIKDGLVDRRRSERDNRVYNLFLTAEGKKVLDSIEDICDAAVGEMLSSLDERDKRELRQSMDSIERLLSKNLPSQKVNPVSGKEARTGAAQARL